MHEETKEITQMILDAAKQAREETKNAPEVALGSAIEWPIQCSIGPGLEGAIACESSIGYVNGSKGWLVYRGYDIFDLCAYSTFEEVCYLLLHGKLPSAAELKDFKETLATLCHVPKTLRLMMSFPVQEMNTMAALRLGTLMLRQTKTLRDQEQWRPSPESAIASDEDSMAMEVPPWGDKQAIYEFRQGGTGSELEPNREVNLAASYRLIAAEATIAASISRLRNNNLPLGPDPELSHAANFLYMMTGRRPTPLEERVMDVALILHADHGMNASTFASMVVASTLSDIYFSVGSGIAALNGPLHGGANEQVLRTLQTIGTPDRAEEWYRQAREAKKKITGFGHRVYKAYDPRARILGPLAKHLAQENSTARQLYQTAESLEKLVVADLGAKKKIFPNVDFYSGIVYKAMGIEPEMFTPIFAVSRVSGWTARILEYLENNRIFRPRAAYTGALNLKYKPVEER